MILKCILDLKHFLSFIKHCTNKAFAALLSDNSVHCWGNSNYGGDSSEASELLDGAVKKIVSTNSAFAALTFHNTVITWGNPKTGGNSKLVQ